MLIFILVLFILSCIVLIFSVMLQTGHGGIGDVFGGSGERALFGGTGAKGLVVKITIISAVVFFATSLILSVLYSRQGRVSTAPQVPVEQPVAHVGGSTTAIPQGQ
ncbi:preprotein translocase subunit SecG [Candidatus Desantisbacteria bacterium CG_4_10_14_0_8_um_filter_48_22]|uniref:Protein-export membrane protein SecG n=1 Tax=Candidatus Desantisbacteria bacterium CG_4_10_14_0_8_um_filter_48_22 TaxID=1974543 RepID=A0A2M7SAW5_9BACT|nr:MAG: preprotein translocase subunit SecG [Candidatus Desantisbacteria bacterium CG1_02_49_89]PIV55761.1 MAG: preprotein translocase subunit SecG [Candidatus Desantisbacteria bacterium CG02_land_8_20_14_3_00_49_13]PIZ16687.1 MAG: preprotein translocase subunit SecG [Candidatus Desantisbacteria bacterium CG_4_10_14_0_8_um_filter_48_22]